MKKLFRSEKYARIGGVCSGIALSQGWSIGGVRLLALLCASTGLGLLAYLVGWLLIPSEGAVQDISYVEDHDPIRRSIHNRKIAGVCGGIGEFLDVDPTIIRVIYVVLVLAGGVGILPYLLAWIIIPEEETTTAS